MSKGGTQNTMARLEQLTPRAPWRRIVAIIEEAQRRSLSGRSGRVTIPVTIETDERGRVSTVSVDVSERYGWE